MWFFLLKILKLVRSLRTHFYMLNSVTFLAVLSSETILTEAFKSIICIVCLTSACILARMRWARWLKRYKHEIINNCAIWSEIIRVIWNHNHNHWIRFQTKIARHEAHYHLIKLLLIIAIELSGVWFGPKSCEWLEITSTILDQTCTPRSSIIT